MGQVLATSKNRKMRWLPLAVNVTSAAVYGYVFYFDYGREELDKILPIPGNQITKFMYLTFCNLLIQFVYHSTGSVLALTAKEDGRDCAFRRGFHYVAVSVAFPLSMTVVGLFWGMYAITPDLVLTKEGKVICAVVWYNHAIHTFPLASMICDFIAWRHPQPTHKDAAKAIVGFTAFYLTDVHMFKYYTGIWAYPVMKQLNTAARMGFFGGCSVIVGANYYLGYHFNAFLQEDRPKIGAGAKRD